MIGFESHDHHHCRADCVARAEAHCASKGVNFTPIRRRVLEILLDGHRAMGAYDILDVLRTEGQRAQPPVAYRALEFLVAHGLAHKIEKMNAFVACSHPGIDHDPAFLICRKCDSVAEATTTPAQGELDEVARKAGFTIERAVLEAEGVCPNCTEGTTE
ncbi:transcriptional repressor [Pontivivens insulae]|uniref:Zinc uptake regulation protein n=1 Tax=Pontivivens insulae TaxID=1639689 RepID=A0A2R8AAJ8_9RHOB|nr:transcriptional repressor [Pontivivens insulae]RED12987.1 Fur family zinc uptake transcriptional regulator [Pontivivens insulae]SPF29080.1 Zinc uptake regulation protein [Pontivivens insulae]